LCRRQRWTGASPKTVRIAFRSAFAPSITNRIPCSGSRPRSTKSESSAVATLAFSVDPSQSPSGTLMPSLVIPSATTLVRSPRSIPSIIITANRTSSRRRLISSDSATRVRSMKVRETEDFDVDLARLLDIRPDGLLRAPVATRRDSREHPLQHRARERITVDEVLVRRQPHLRAAIGAPDTRSLDPYAPAAGRHLARLAAVPHGPALRVVLAPRADHLVELLREQLGQHAQADPDREREHPSLAEPTSSPSASCTRGGNATPSPPTCSSDTVFMAVPPPVKFYELRDNLADRLTSARSS
jgi:hypothetical protein